ncbi:5994_t:CDS:2, partial [Racocetra fulgida]
KLVEMNQIEETQTEESQMEGIQLEKDQVEESQMEGIQLEESQLEENQEEGFVYRDTLRKRKSRKDETPQQHTAYQHDTNADISEHEDESDLLYTNSQLEFSVFLRSMETENEREDEQNGLDNTDLQLVLDTSQSGDNNIVIQHTDPLSAYLNKADQKLLQRFRHKMDKLEHKLYESNVESEENVITSTFVSLLPSDNREETAINNTLN